jgi:hypothetical protein
MQLLIVDEKRGEDLLRLSFQGTGYKIFCIRIFYGHILAPIGML